MTENILKLTEERRTTKVIMKNMRRFREELENHVSRKKKACLMKIADKLINKTTLKINGEKTLKILLSK